MAMELRFSNQRDTMTESDDQGSAVMSEQDPRRQRPVEVKWLGAAEGPRTLGRIEIDGEHWGNVEWSDTREVWCIEDIWGACLRHTDHIRGQEASREAAVALAKEMIRDGRMPTPEEARAQGQAANAAREAKREARKALSDKPANVRARQRRKEKDERSRQLSQARWRAEERDDDETPLWESIADAFDFSDPNLWRSNSFASLRPRLVIWMQRIVAELEEDLDHAAKRRHPWGGKPEPADFPKRRVARLAPKLARAREILALLEDDPNQQSLAAE
jgi:hypothetical protein